MRTRLSRPEWYAEAIRIFNSMPDSATIVEIRNKITEKIGPHPDGDHINLSDAYRKRS